MAFIFPSATLFLNHNPNKLVVACKFDIFLVDLITPSTEPFKSTPHGACYNAHALALSDDDTVLVAGSYGNNPNIVCGYDTASLSRLWIHKTGSDVNSICILGARVLVTVYCNSTLVLDFNTGAHIATLLKADEDIFGMGVIEGLGFFSILA
jgi:hypothetical protein